LAHPPKADGHGTPIFDALAAEVGLEWPDPAIGWFDPSTPPAPEPDA